LQGTLITSRRRNHLHQRKIRLNSSRSRTGRKADMTCRSFLIAAFVSLFLVSFSTMLSVLASPLSSYQPPIVVRQMVQPYFPGTPASCPICAKGYPSINSCAQAAPVLANFTAVRAHRLCISDMSPDQISHIFTYITGRFQSGRVHRRD
jgi:hypothetical protein